VLDTEVDYERRFRRSGLPLLIEGYSAREDVFTRAVPFLALWFVTELLNAVNLAWSTALVLFVNTEMWQVFAAVSDGDLAGVAGLFVALGAVFLRVSAAIASFSGLYYAIAVLTDSTYRAEFFDQLEASMRDTFRLRAKYVARRAGPAAG
jgi:hypothetical protein